MGSHGVPRFQAPQTDVGREKERKKIAEYTGAVNLVKLAILEGAFTEETLGLTTKVLALNPEYYTGWNQRRRVLQGLFNSYLNSQQPDQASPVERIRSLLAADLEFLLPLLIQYPKCYWIWNHRQWTLQQFPEYLSHETARNAWESELSLVSKMLERDSRNFHGWDYRRKVVFELRKYAHQERNPKDGQNLERAKSEPERVPPAEEKSSITESEYAYTTEMIKSNLSNFSAWHNRSKLIPRLLNERNSTNEQRKELFQDELSLIDDAVFTDPYDQSLWFYHAHLITVMLGGHKQGTNTPTDVFVKMSNFERIGLLEAEMGKIRELLEDCDDCKWIYQYLLEYATRYMEIEGGNMLFTSQDMKDWLNRLTQLDPLRKGRWHDWEQHLNL